jgi:hypothetical protein
MFVDREYSASGCTVNEPIEVRLRFGSAAGLDYYVAVEDTMPPGFEVDKNSLAANVKGQLQSFSVRADKVTFFVNSLDAPMEVLYRVIPTISGSVVAPPAKLFPMYSSDKAVYSCSAELAVKERAEAPVDGSGEYVAEKAPGAAPPSREEPAAAGKRSPSAVRTAGQSDESGEPEVELPEFRIDWVQMVGQARSGQIVRFIASVRMAGFSTEIPFNVYAYMDDRIIKVESLRLAPSTEGFSVEIEWKATPGPHVLKVMVDPMGWVSEGDESNNNMDVGFYIQRPAVISRQTASPWQAGLLGLDALISMALTAGLYGPARRLIEKRRGKGRQVFQD